ncbi:hypothetical protein [Leptospira levettii]|uniref:hypothetical protein n=1 Tax=Leptospira levettii TaxID=2023178 RepID=UPI00223D7B7C|nr:hypothetical protein [Leptospira levettii]MCW7475631.1 hypothetical protein [Leptospira levettii]
MSDENKQYLEFIQHTINRMASNSFYIKGFSVTVLSAIFAIFANNPYKYILIVGYFPTISSWLLDTYYLQLERQYRNLYNDATGITTYKPVSTYDLNAKDYILEDDKFYKIAISFSQILTYPPILAILTFLLIFFKPDSK